VNSDTSFQEASLPRFAIELSDTECTLEMRRPSSLAPTAFDPASTPVVPRPAWTRPAAPHVAPAPLSAPTLTVAGVIVAVSFVASVALAAAGALVEHHSREATRTVVHAKKELALKPSTMWWYSSAR
jgi:hypothetical protein